MTPRCFALRCRLCGCLFVWLCRRAVTPHVLAKRPLYCMHCRKQIAQHRVSI